ncbi:acyl-CoA thioesterase [Urechidicola croceus]|uniref:Thioesterase n=1 Tax=Urechidicola croceus TaxID=1850246 RepID=A0A1D8PA88_9FLAO|nr:acyl-CoA thioesterase [Urechidicola croceus]AOW21498.1 thioesterase [Urechidicola croceus]
MNKILESKTKVRFQDCDPFNHLNNSKYIDYFINAREDQLIENYDLNIYKVAFSEGVGWVVGSNQISYLKPVNTMEVVTIESQLINFTKQSIEVELRMYNENKTELKSVMWSKFIHIDMKTQRSIEHNKKYIDLFESVYLPVSENTFDERFKSILKKQY